MTYQVDLAERRDLLDTWLRDVGTDLDGARQALRHLTLLDGPQSLAVGAGIAAAVDGITRACSALDRDPVASGQATRQTQMYTAHLGRVGTPA